MSVRGLRRVALVLAAYAATGCVPDQPVRSPVQAFLSDAVCGKATLGVLGALGVGETFVHAPPGPDGAQSIRIPTSRFAEWVALDLPIDAPPIVALLTPDSIVEIAFRSDCAPIERVVHERFASDDRLSFTDAYLHHLIEDAAPAPLVVYIWSPHMPLAPDGWPEIVQAAARTGMRVAPALIAHGDRAFALREAERVGLPEEGLREITAIELTARQAQVHAPSIVIFGQDLVSPVLPGYRNTEGYLRYLEGFIADRPRRVTR